MPRASCTMYVPHLTGRLLQGSPIVGSSPAVTNWRDPVSLGRMVREISAGGVVVRKALEGWEIAVIEPQKGRSGAGASANKRSQKVVLALPKGLVDAGEKPEQTAVREVREEAGITARLIRKLVDVKYVYTRSWGDKQRVFKVVSFYLLRYESGTIDDIPPEMRIEVKRALWMRLEEAAKKLAYRGEREAVSEAWKYLEAHPEVRDEG